MSNNGKGNRNTEKKNKNKKSVEHTTSLADVILNSYVGTLVLAAVTALISVFAFILPQGDNKPITRDEALEYVGAFEEYEEWKNYSYIIFADGSEYDTYTHVMTVELTEKIKSLEKGTQLYILVNPNNGYVIEAKTDSEEIINFDDMQREIDNYDNGYVGIGIFMICASVLLVLYTILRAVNGRGETARQSEALEKRLSGKDSRAIRRADTSVKCRVLLETEAEGLRICYRRVKSTNELVVNDDVYDERRGVVEFEHKMMARVGGRVIEVGLDGDSVSFIKLDGERIAERKRHI